MSFSLSECIQHFHHAGFIVKDLDRSLDFYLNKLGFQLTMRWIETPEQCDVGMGVPGCTLELAQMVGYGVMLEVAQYLTASGSDAPIAPNHIGVGHVSFEVNDLAGLVAHLESQGIQMASERMIVPELNITWVHVLDPDGIRIEFMQFLNK